MKPASKIGIFGALLLLGGCVSMPSGPSVMVLPGTGKNFDQFRADEMDCRQFASSQVGGDTPDGAAENSVARSAALGRNSPRRRLPRVPAQARRSADGWLRGADGDERGVVDPDAGDDAQFPRPLRGS